MDSAERRAFGLKDLPEAMQLRNQVLRAFAQCLDAAIQNNCKIWSLAFQVFNEVIVQRRDFAIFLRA